MLLVAALNSSSRMTMVTQAAMIVLVSGNPPILAITSAGTRISGRGPRKKKPATRRTTAITAICIPDSFGTTPLLLVHRCRYHPVSPVEADPKPTEEPKEQEQRFQAQLLVQPETAQDPNDQTDGDVPAEAHQPDGPG